MMKCPLLLLLFFAAIHLASAEGQPHTRIALRDGRWWINGRLTNAGSAAEGLLMNVRMVNATFEDSGRPELDPTANTARFIERIPDYAVHG